MNGVLDMVFLSIIRRWHKREHVPIREISRRLCVSRNTIRKYLRSDQIELKFQVRNLAKPCQPSAIRLTLPPAAAVLIEMETSSASQLRQ